VAQTVLQAVVPSQTYGAHDFEAGVAHPPAPSQKAMLVKMPEAHDAAAQLVDVPLIEAHLVRSAPSQVAWQTPVPAHAVRVLPCTAPATATHVPTLPPTSHASHCPLQALSQQTPSTQNRPGLQEVVAAHCAP
jgi:hypothetical protein